MPHADTQIHANLHFYTTLLSPSTSLKHTLKPRTSPSPNSDKLFYAQLVQSSGYNTGPAPSDPSYPRIKISMGGQEATLGEGDGVFVRGVKEGDVVGIENIGGKVGELVFFEMDA